MIVPWWHTGQRRPIQASVALAASLFDVVLAEVAAAGAFFLLVVRGWKPATYCAVWLLDTEPAVAASLAWSSGDSVLAPSDAEGGSARRSGSSVGGGAA